MLIWANNSVILQKKVWKEIEFYFKIINPINSNMLNDEQSF